MGTSGYAIDEVVLQGRRRQHVDWWELSIKAAARRSLQRSEELIFVTSAVGLSSMI